MKNIKKKEQIYDGFEDDFYQKLHNIQCSYYDEQIAVKVTELKRLELLESNLKQKVIGRIKGITSENGAYYRYDNLQVVYGLYPSTKDNMELVALFAIGESQPARYQITVLGIFRY